MADIPKPKLLPARLALGLGLIDETAYKRAKARHRRERSLDVGLILLEQGAITRQQLDLIRRLLGVTRKRPDRKHLLRELGAPVADTGGNPKVRIPTSSPWRAGKVVLNRYRVVRPLGRGAMGDVVQAFDAFLGCQVAIKAPHLRLASNAIAMQALRDEVALAHAVNHPNVARTFDMGEVDGLPYVSMELIEGTTLTTELAREGPLPEARARQIALLLCDALAAAHQAGVVHRDLKPGNVMLVDAPRHVVVMDFGIAAAIQDASTTQTKLDPGEPAAPATSVATDHDGPSYLYGTPTYMSPEQWRGDPADPRSDIYQLGVLLYRILAGKLPFEGEDTLELCRKHTLEKPPPLREAAPDVTPRMAELVERCLAKDPAARPQTMAEVAAALKRRDRLAVVVRGAITSAVLAAVLFVAGWGLLRVARTSILQSLRPATARLALLAARGIDVSDLRGVRVAADTETAGFRRVRRHLLEIKRANPEVRFIYTLRKRQGSQWEFVVDADPFDEDRNGDGTIQDEEEGSPPGLEYDAAEYPAMQATIDELRARADPDFAMDHWGFLLSGYAPIVDGETGERYVLGVDVGNAQIERVRDWTGQLFVLLWIALSAFGFRYWMAQVRAEE